MIAEKALLSRNNLNNAYISKTDTATQMMASNLTLSGGALTLKNSVITDNASTGYLRIDPQGNSVILYDGVNNQNLKVFSSSGNQAIYLTAVNGTTPIGILDALGITQIGIATNSGAKTIFGGSVDFNSASGTIQKRATTGNTLYTIIDAEARVTRAVYNDLAELFLSDSKEKLEAGDVLIYNGKGVIKSSDYADKRVVGVYSDTFGFLLGGENKTTEENIKSGYIPVGISGRVLVKVTGDIDIGDLLTSSHIQGVATKSKDNQIGTIIGKALESHSKENGISRIWMLIMNN